MTFEAGLLGLLFILLGLSLVASARPVDRWMRLRNPDGHRLTEIATSDDLIASDRLDVRTWAISRERDSYLLRRGRSFLYAIAGGMIFLGAAILLAGQADAPKLSDPALWRTGASAAGFLGAVIVLYSTVPYLSARSAFRQRRLATASARVDDAISRACEGEAPLKIGRLFELNRRQLDEYQLLTRKQQRSSFLLAQAASVVAFVVLVAGVFLALSTKSDVDKFLTSGLTALGSLLSGFLAATFFKSSRDANEQMNRYYLEPQRTGRLLAAERIVTQISPDGKSRADMIAAVLSWDMPGDPSAPKDTASPNGTTLDVAEKG